MAQQSILLINGILDFSARLYGLLASQDGNIFISPYSISAALLLTDLGANGKTETEIRAAFGAENVAKTEIHKYYKELEGQLNDETKGTTSLSIANRIFTRLGLEIDKEYTKNSKEYYNSGIDELDFICAAENSRNHINKWVEEQTRNKITNLLQPGTIGRDSLMVLVNAIYFKGEWLKPFDGSDTRKSDFHLNVGTKKRIDMMFSKERLKYTLDNDIGYSAVKLPYKDCSIAMVIILPNAIDGLANLEKKLDPTLLRDILQKVGKANRPEVQLGIPKFKMEANYKLETVLPKLGIISMFDSNMADFSAILPKTPDAFISDAIHKTFVEVNEKGTEAAGATAMVVRLGSAMPLEPPKRFIADHPFLFLITDTRTDAVLFMGRYQSPPA